MEAAEDRLTPTEALTQLRAAWVVASPEERPVIAEIGRAVAVIAEVFEED